jgi:hypothetical protein
MLLKGYNRDFRNVCETKWRFETGMAFGKSGKARALREQAQDSAKGGKQFPSPYSGSAGRGGKGWGQGGWRTAAWTGATAWASQWSTADGSQIAIRGQGRMTEREEIPGSSFTTKLLYYFLGFIFALAILSYICAMVRKCFIAARGYFNPYRPYSVRTVGIQTQTTYTGERFKAFENGFKRAGEVEIVLHESDPKKRD